MFKIFEALSQDILAIDFGSNEIKGALVKNANSVITVNSISTTPTPRNAVKDGRIRYG